MGIIIGDPRPYVNPFTDINKIIQRGAEQRLAFEMDKRRQEANTALTLMQLQNKNRLADRSFGLSERELDQKISASDRRHAFNVSKEKTRAKEAEKKLNLQTENKHLPKAIVDENGQLRYEMRVTDPNKQAELQKRLNKVDQENQGRLDFVAGKQAQNKANRDEIKRKAEAKRAEKKLAEIRLTDENKAELERENVKLVYNPTRDKIEYHQNGKYIGDH